MSTDGLNVQAVGMDNENVAIYLQANFGPVGPTFMSKKGHDGELQLRR